MVDEVRGKRDGAGGEGDKAADEGDNGAKVETRFTEEKAKVAVLNLNFLPFS